MRDPAGTVGKPDIIATFNSSTGWAGRTVSYQNGGLFLEDHGPITAAGLLEYDRLGQVNWSRDGLREWAYQRKLYDTSVSASGGWSAEPVPVDFEPGPRRPEAKASPPKARAVPVHSRLGPSGAASMLLHGFHNKRQRLRHHCSEAEKALAALVRNHREPSNFAEKALAATVENREHTPAVTRAPVAQMVTRIAPSARPPQAPTAPAAAPAPSEPLRPLNFVERAVAATVEIQTKFDCGYSVGSGFILIRDGLVATACHVVHHDRQPAQEILVRLFPGQPGERVIPATIFSADPIFDYALLWLHEAGPYPTLTPGRTDELRYADVVFAVGSPSGLSNTVSRGVVSNPRTRIGLAWYIQTDAALSKGSSGGPLLNERGMVLGVNVRSSETVDAAHFALPIDYVIPSLKEALRRGRDECISSSTGVATPMSSPVDSRDGTSFETAIIVDSLDEEYAWLRTHYPGWKVERQTLVDQGEIPFDVMTMRNDQGAEVELYFDVSKFFGHEFDT